VAEELIITKDILRIFGEALGLKANLQKSNVISIRCDDEFISAISETLPCSSSVFPCTYLGLPLSNKKLQKPDLLPWIDKLEDRLPSWKASLKNKAGHATLVHFVLSAMPIYLLIAIDVPKWFIKAVDKIRKGFFMERTK
jgi:hypothetical protein